MGEALKVKVGVYLYNRILSEGLSYLLSTVEGVEVVPIDECSLLFVDKPVVATDDVEEAFKRGVKVLLVDTGLSEEEAVFLVKNFPVSGIVYPEMEVGLLKKCIERVILGESWFKREFLSVVSRRRETLHISQLTEKEKQIIDLLLQGKTNKEVGKELGLAEQTIKYYLNQLFKKTGCSNRTALIGFLSKVYPLIRGQGQKLETTP